MRSTRARPGHLAGARQKPGRGKRYGYADSNLQNPNRLGFLVLCRQ